ncbi:sugar phosphate isomerase/epimerase family protein [Paenibacillus piri]|uniref:Sugar phosphate isomerase/epimerase n=1 Tax=Paenibacillus piri TaxID=2547395 RepID=A0A4R5KD47_9BACL|nr:sugar phosphate isomerase/epimerase family protein [Paenibacillus piri]TDF92010.1 sugar phosphate isomerase/epimerase [Paenibacillus piri]
MIWDRLGVLTDEVSANIGEALDWTERNGLRHVELRTVDGCNIMDAAEETLERIRKEAERRGLYISAIASPVFKCALDASRPVAGGDTFGQQELSVDAHFEMLARAIRIAARLNTSRIRIFSFWREKDPGRALPEIVDLLKAAAALAKREQVTLLLENEPSCNGGCASEVGHIVRLVGSDALKALWDPGNEAYGGKSAFPEGYAEVKDMISHVHLKDAFTDAGGTGRCVPIGSGAVDYPKQIRALEDDGYQGLYTIETHYIPPGGTAMDGTDETLAGLRRLLF